MLPSSLILSCPDYLFIIAPYALKLFGSSLDDLEFLFREASPF